MFLEVIDHFGKKSSSAAVHRRTGPSALADDPDASSNGAYYGRAESGACQVRSVPSPGEVSR